MTKSTLFLPMVVWFLGMVIVLLVICIYFERKETRLLSQCMADGFREYECVAILAGGKIYDGRNTD